MLEMKCPKCPNTTLRVEPEMNGLGVIEFRDDGTQEKRNIQEYDIWYTDDGEVRCSECGHTCTVKEAKAAAQGAVEVRDGVPTTTD